MSEPDMVNSPPHYVGKNGLQVIDVIEEFDLGFHRGNATKYVIRAGKKDDEIQDIEKAIYFLARSIGKVFKEVPF